MDPTAAGEQTPMHDGAMVERTSEHELVFGRTVRGPARLVFEAWTRPELFERWWAPKSFPIRRSPRCIPFVVLPLSSPLLPPPSPWPPARRRARGSGRSRSRTAR
jgi:hypothetical protein